MAIALRVDAATARPKRFQVGESLQADSFERLNSSGNLVVGSTLIATEELRLGSITAVVGVLGDAHFASLLRLADIGAPGAPGSGLGNLYTKAGAGLFWHKNGQAEVNLVAAGSGYATIEDEGTPLAQESVIDFQGAGVEATAGSGQTIVTIPGLSTTDMPAVQARRTTTVTLSDGTFNDVTFNVTDVENDTAVVEHDDTNTDRFTCKETGLYYVEYRAFGLEAGATTIQARVTINDDATTIPGSDCDSNSLAHNQDHDWTFYCEFLVELTADDYLTLQTQKTGSGSSTMIAGTSFRVVRMATGASGGGGDAGTDLYDAVVPDDFSLPSAAFSAGNSSVYVRTGTYVETADVAVPTGGRLSGEDLNAVIDLSSGFSVTMDGSARKETTGTIGFTSGSTAVTGSGTTFTNLQAGDYIGIGAVFFEIDTITDATNLDLVEVWEGRTRSGFPMYGLSMISDVLMENITVLGATGTGLELTQLRDSHFDNVVVESCLNNILMVDCGSMLIDGLRSSHSTNDGIDILGSRTIRFDECHFENNAGHGFQMGANSLAIKCAGCEADGNGVNGFDMAAGTDLHINSCGSKNNDGKGINTASGTIRCTIGDGTIEFNDGDGVDFDGSENVIEGNQIGNNGGDGILAGSEGVITGNHIHDNTGIGINLGGTDDNCTVVGNAIHNNGGNGITAAGDECVLAGNSIYDNTGTGLLVSGTDNEVGQNHIRGNTVADYTDSGTNTRFSVASNNATVNPAVTDDAGDGYLEGFIWVNTTADTAFILVDSTVGAAVWIKISQSGTLDLGDQDIINVKSLTGGEPVSQTTASTTLTIDFAAGNHHRITVDRDITAVVLLNPLGATGLTVEILQDGTGDWDISGWPPRVDWLGGTDPVFGDGASAKRLVNFYFNGVTFDDYIGEFNTATYS